eukprot:5597910-Amphidinium_carterae.1
MAWLAWGLLLHTRVLGLVRKAANLSRAATLCHDALSALPGHELALRCLVIIALESPLSASGGWTTAFAHALSLAMSRPIKGLVVFGRVLLRDQSCSNVGAMILREAIAELRLDGSGAEQTATAVLKRHLTELQARKASLSPVLEE